MIPSLLLLACSPPGPPGLRLLPEAPTTLDTLRVEQADGSPLEPDWYIEWFRDGAPRPELGSEVYPIETRKGERWSARVETPWGEERLETTILDAPPAASLQFPAATIHVGTDLEPAVDVVDPDGDELYVELRWSCDGVEIDAGSVLPGADTELGQRWTATVQAWDGELWSEPASDTVLLVNQRPEFDELYFYPDPPTTAAALRARYAVHDPDHDQVEVTFHWYVEGEPVQEGTSPTLPPSSFHKHERVELYALPFDGYEQGKPGHLSTEVANSPPTAPGIALPPPWPGDDLLCELVEPSEDSDGDPVDYRVSWTVDGKPFEGAGTTELPGDTVPAGQLAPGQEWSCTVTPYDPEDEGSPATASVQVPLDATIYELQSGELAASSAHIRGVVATTPHDGQGFAVSEPEGGPWSGLWVEDGGALAGRLERATLLELVGVLEERDGRTVLVTDASRLRLLGMAEEPPPEPVDEEDLGELATSEPYDGVLVEVTGDLVVSDPGGERWVLDGTLLVGRSFWDGPEDLAAGDCFSALRGVLLPEANVPVLQPRDAEDASE